MTIPDVTRSNRLTVAKNSYFTDHGMGGSSKDEEAAEKEFTDKESLKSLSSNGCTEKGSSFSASSKDSINDNKYIRKIYLALVKGCFPTGSTVPNTTHSDTKDNKYNDDWIECSAPIGVVSYCMSLQGCYPSSPPSLDNKQTMDTINTSVPYTSVHYTQINESINNSMDNQSSARLHSGKTNEPPQIAKQSLTRFKRLWYDPEKNCSLVMAMPITGRTHQIRVHLEFLGHPILNDPLYANELWQLPQVQDIPAGCGRTLLVAKLMAKIMNKTLPEDLKRANQKSKEEVSIENETLPSVNDIEVGDEVKARVLYLLGMTQEEGILNGTQKGLRNGTEEGPHNRTEEGTLNTTEESTSNGTKKGTQNTTQEVTQNRAEVGTRNGTDVSDADASVQLCLDDPSVDAAMSLCNWCRKGERQATSVDGMFLYLHAWDYCIDGKRFTTQLPWWARSDGSDTNGQ